jgi:hypothetical protein
MTSIGVADQVTSPGDGEIEAPAVAATISAT